MDRIIDDRNLIFENILNYHNNFIDVNSIGNMTYNNKRYPMIIYNSKNNSDKNLLITAGIHGSEEAGVNSIEEIIDNILTKYNGKFNFTIMPCINPSGYLINERKNADKIDVNRSFIENSLSQESIILMNYFNGKKYDIVINLHEDNPKDADEEYPESILEPYLYLVSQKDRKEEGHKILDIMRKHGFIITDAKDVYGDFCENGLIWEDSDNHKSIYSGTFENYLVNKSKTMYTSENPTDWRLNKRKDYVKKICDAIIKTI
jgi:hypothetical protein